VYFGRRCVVAINSLPKTCWICGKTLRLEDCKIDEHGLGVHENCYVAKITQEKAPPPQPRKRF
jgi:hypothetical protein